jgi:hypothetical protein
VHTTGVGSNAEFPGQVRVDVEVDTLDGLVERAGLTRLDFVKIDVEGGELAVLRGGGNAIDEFRPTLLVEIEDRHTSRYQHTAADVVTELTKRGYTIAAWQRRHRPPAGGPPPPGGWLPTDGICAHVRNYLFRPPTRLAAPARAEAVNGRR